MTSPYILLGYLFNYIFYKQKIGICNCNYSGGVIAQFLQNTSKTIKVIKL